MRNPTSHPVEKLVQGDPYRGQSLRLSRDLAAIDLSPILLRTLWRGRNNPTLKHTDLGVRGQKDRDFDTDKALKSDGSIGPRDLYLSKVHLTSK